MYVPNNRVLKYVTQKLIELKGEIDEPTIIVRDFKHTLPVIKRSSRQKISKDVIELKSTINQLDLVDIYRILHPTTQNTLFSSSHGTPTKIDHVLGHKTQPFQI